VRWSPKILVKKLIISKNYICPKNRKTQSLQQQAQHRKRLVRKDNAKVATAPVTADLAPKAQVVPQAATKTAVVAVAAFVAKDLAHTKRRRYA
jgi:hypothetical protein